MTRDETLHASLFVYASTAFARHGNDASDEDVLAWAQHLASYPDAGWQSAAIDAFDWTPAQQIFRGGTMGKVRRVQARVVRVRARQTHRVLTASRVETFPTSRVVDLIGTDDTEFASLPVLDEAVADRLESRAAGIHPLDLLVVVLSLPSVPHDRARSFAVHILDAQPAESARAVVAASARERAEADETLNSTSRRALWQIIADRVMDSLAVRRTAGDKLDLACSGVVLEALSMGVSNGFSMKLSSALVGPPGQGKSLAGKVLEAVAPRFVRADAPTLSAAGMQGRTRRRPSDDPLDTAGLFDFGRNGAICIEDAHTIEPSHARSVFTVMAAVMDHGKGRSGRHGGGEYDAPVSIHIDANLDWHLTVGPAPPVRAARITSWRPLLTRFDLLLYVEASRARSGRVAKKLLRRSEVKSELRKLRVLVATLLDRHPEVDLSHVQGAMDRALGKCDAWIESHPGAIAYATELRERLATSLRRLTMAVARGNDRSVATAGDVGEAQRYVMEKLEALARIEREADEARATPKKSVVDRRAAVVRRELRKGTRTRVQLLDAVEKATGERLHDEQLARVVKAAGGVRKERGKWGIG